MNQLEEREERLDEEAWERKMKRWEDWVKGHEKIFGESQCEWWREVWGDLGPFPYHGWVGGSCDGGDEGEETLQSLPRWVCNGVGGIRVRGFQAPSAPPPTY